VTAEVKVTPAVKVKQKANIIKLYQKLNLILQGVGQGKMF
jgi:hypothetical protein